MNTVLILFLVAVILIALFMFVRYYNPDFLIREPKPLMSSSRAEIPVGNIDMPGAVRYYYESWIYINGNAPIHSANVLFNRGSDLVVVLMGSTLNIYVNVNSAGGSGVNSEGVLDLSGGLKPIASIPDFPFQKWAQLVIYVDGLSMDIYLDGKFVKNAKNATTINVTVDKPIQYGNKYTDGKITRFRRPAESVNPQKVWNSYMLGSGENTSVSDYHLNAQVTKNKHVRIDQRIF